MKQSVPTDRKRKCLTEETEFKSFIHNFCFQNMSLMSACLTELKNFQMRVLQMPLRFVPSLCTCIYPEQTVFKILIYAT